MPTPAPARRAAVAAAAVIIAFHCGAEAGEGFGEAAPTATTAPPRVVAVSVSYHIFDTFRLIR